MTSSSKTQRSLIVYEQMARLVRAWEATPDKLLRFPVKTRGDGIHLRQTFYVWRDQNQRAGNFDSIVVTSLSITAKMPILIEDQWYVLFVERSDFIKEVLDSMGIPPAAPAVPAAPAPEPFGRTAPPLEPERPEPLSFDEVYNRYFGKNKDDTKP